MISTYVYIMYYNINIVSSVGMNLLPWSWHLIRATVLTWLFLLPRSTPASQIYVNLFGNVELFLLYSLDAFEHTVQ